MHAIQQSSWDRDWLQQWRRETETYIKLCCRFSACLDDVISVVTWHGATTRCDVIIDVLTSTSAAAVSATTRCRLSTEQPSGNSRSPVSATHTYCRAGSDNAQIFSARSVSARWCTRVRFRALQFARRNVYPCASSRENASRGKYRRVIGLQSHPHPAIATQYRHLSQTIKHCLISYCSVHKLLFWLTGLLKQNCSKFIVYRNIGIDIWQCACSVQVTTKKILDIINRF